MNNYRIITVFCVLCGIIAQAHDDRKRFILNNPSEAEQSIQNLNGHVVELALSVSALENKTSLIGPLKSLIIQQEVAINNLKQSIANRLSQTGNGAVYTRWGKKTCPSGAHMIYTGYAGAGAYNYYGSFTNFLCLPDHPTGNPRDSALARGLDNFLYGVEYETNFWGTHSQDEDVPCAVCKDATASSHVMIPDQSTCNTGWKLAYEGYLGSGYYGHGGNKEAICVDSNPDYLNGGVANADGGLLYPVLVKCGSLACPPYEDSDAVSCVVCVL